MTPQLQQGIRLLGLNKFELKQFLENELLQNPILEFTDLDGVNDLSNLKDCYPINNPQCAIFGGVGTDSVDHRESYNNYGWGNSISTNGQDVALQGHQIRDWSRGGAGSVAKNAATVASEQFLSNNKSLKDYVLEQMHFVLTSTTNHRSGVNRKFRRGWLFD